MKKQKSEVGSRKSEVGTQKAEGRNEGRFQRQTQVLILACCLLPAAFSLTGCRERTAAAETTPVSVRTGTVELNSVSSGVRYSASIEPAKQVELSFKVGGYVEALMQARGVDGRMRDVQEGDVVTKGAVLARVRQSDFAVKVSQAQAQAAEMKSGLESSQAQYAEAQSSVASSKAQLAEADAALGKAQLDFERAKNLFASQSMTKADFDAVKAQFESAEARRNAARSQVAVVEAKASSAAAQIEVLRARASGAQATITEATIPLADTALRAPMNAVVLQKNVEVGALVSAGKAGFTVADTSSVKAVFGVPDLVVNKLKPGSALAVTTESLPGTEFQGRITRIAPSADPKSRVFEIEVTIPNPRQLLKSGFIASLELTDAAPSRQVAVVPLAAIVRAKDKPDEYAVFVIEEKSGRQIARLRQVRLGEAFGNTIAVLEGINTGERVITTGATLVIDGQQVQVIP
ncbi:MAG: efflux RND transporter periplasmic adaptor subunit [Blastocatellia bacterium]